jgi:adenosylmethionine-8-amino-7-oxononanoate aminotransferase
VLWHPFTQAAIAAPPLPVVAAEGAWLQLEDGRRVLDAISSWWTSVHGHSHPAIARAIARQAAELDHVLLAGCTHPGAVALAEKLCALAPPGLTRVFYSDDGSTAVEVALKLALQYQAQRGRPDKRQLAALEHGYHGDTLGAMSVGDPRDFAGPFRSVLYPVLRVPTGSLHALESLLRARGPEIAALVMEPMVQGAGGMILTGADFLAGAARLCREHDVLFIADEVMTGFGRTGRMFAVEHAGVAPDLMCVAKGLTGGALPLAATLATEAIYEAFLDADPRRAFLHGHSFTGNPIACAAALASLALFEEAGALDRIRAIEAFYAATLPRFASHPRVRDVRWLGLIGAVELESCSTGYFADEARAISKQLLDQGYLVRPLGPVIYTLPPYVVEIDDLAALYQSLFDLL